MPPFTAATAGKARANRKSKWGIQSTVARQKRRGKHWREKKSQVMVTPVATPELKQKRQTRGKTKGTKRKASVLEDILIQRDATIEDQDATIEEQKRTIAQRDKTIVKRDKTIAHLKRKFDAIRKKLSRALAVPSHSTPSSETHGATHAGRKKKQRSD
jgi:uncharacterized coiled-coil protein SlyX